MQSSSLQRWQPPTCTHSAALMLPWVDAIDEAHKRIKRAEGLAQTTRTHQQPMLLFNTFFYSNILQGLFPTVCVLSLQIGTSDQRFTLLFLVLEPWRCARDVAFTGACGDLILEHIKKAADCCEKRVCFRCSLQAEAALVPLSKLLQSELIVLPFFVVKCALI